MRSPKNKVKAEHCTWHQAAVREEKESRLQLSAVKTCTCGDLSTLAQAKLGSDSASNASQRESAGRTYRLCCRRVSEWKSHLGVFTSLFFISSMNTSTRC